MAARTTKTINRLHFSDLDPLRFEDLCLNLVSRLQTWKELNHFGRSGNDNGVDIHAIEKIGNDDARHWHIQCKRYTRITKTDIEIIFKALDNHRELPDKFLLIISCDISRSLYDFFKQKCQTFAIKDSEVWTASTLESRLYKDYTDLLFTYFGVKLESKKVDNATKIRHSLRMQKRMQKDFLRHEFIKDRNNWELIQYEPWYKFIDHDVYIHSIDDQSYPEYDAQAPEETISPWFKTMLYNFYHNGIELWVNAAMGYQAIICENGEWELIDYDDSRKGDPNYNVKRVHMVARIPFSSIVDYKTGGDEYSSEPHIYCRFEHNGTPYEKIYYKTYGFFKERWFPEDLDEKKQIIRVG